MINSTGFTDTSVEGLSIRERQNLISRKVMKVALVICGVMGVYFFLLKDPRAFVVTVMLAGAIHLESKISLKDSIIRRLNHQIRTLDIKNRHAALEISQLRYTSI